MLWHRSWRYHLTLGVLSKVPTVLELGWGSETEHATRGKRPYCTPVWSVSLWKVLFETQFFIAVSRCRTWEKEWLLYSQLADACLKLTTTIWIMAEGQRWLKNVLDNGLKIWFSELCGRFKISRSMLNAGHCSCLNPEYTFKTGC